MAKGYILSKESAKDFKEMRARFRGTHGRPRQEQRRRVRTGGSGGGSLVYATSPNTTFDASFTYGAVGTNPSSDTNDYTALTSDAVFNISTPWNTSASAPDKLFGWWNKVGDNYYMPVDKFYIKPSVNYPAGAGAGIETFTCYYNKKDTHSLGANTAFPSGIKAVLDGFSNTTASTDSKAYFNGKIFPCSYDSENNIIYIDHPIY